MQTGFFAGLTSRFLSPFFPAWFPCLIRFPKAQPYMLQAPKYARY